MNHGTCVTQVQWCMPGSLTSCGGENVPGIPGACTTRKFTYLVKRPCRDSSVLLSKWITTVLHCVTFASQATYHPLIDSLLVIIIAGRKHHYHYHYFYIIIYNTHRSTYNVAVWHPVSIIKFCWSFVETVKSNQYSLTATGVTLLIIYIGVSIPRGPCMLSTIKGGLSLMHLWSFLI